MPCQSVQVTIYRNVPFRLLQSPVTGSLIIKSVWHCYTIMPEPFLSNFQYIFFGGWGSERGGGGVTSRREFFSGRRTCVSFQLPPGTPVHITFHSVTLDRFRNNSQFHSLSLKVCRIANILNISTLNLFSQYLKNIENGQSLQKTETIPFYSGYIYK